MATETITRLIDDLDGGSADRTVRLGWDGAVYELDLSKKNIAALEKLLKPYLDASRPAANVSRRRPSRSAPTSRRREDLHAVRDWARSNGFTPSERGRVSGEILAAYHAAH